jgi:hypothetical protein
MKFQGSDEEIRFFRVNASLSEFHTTDLVSQIFPPLADQCVPLDPRCHAERGKSTTSCKEKVSG